MTCENQHIADMLVPYVEGALAEAERAEVTDHLRHCPACREEARVLRDTIVGLRGVFSAGYRPTLAAHPPAEEVSAFVLEPQTLAEEKRSALHVHMLECDDCAAEAQLLRDMHADLEGRVAAGGAPLVLPRALREEIEAAYPAGRPLPPRVEGAAALPFTERLAHLLSRFNWRPVLATGLAAVVLTFGFLFAYSGRQAEMAVETTTTTSTSVAASPMGADSPAPAPAAPTEVPLLVPAGKAEESAQALDKEKIPYQNRDGKLYLAPGDVERARRVLDQPEPEPPQIAMADRAESREEDGAPAASAPAPGDARTDDAPAVEEAKASEPEPAAAPPPPPPAPVERPRSQAPAPAPPPAAPRTVQTGTQSRQEVALGASGRTPAAPPASTSTARSSGTVAVSRPAADESAPAPRPVPMTVPNAPAGGPAAGEAQEAPAAAPPVAITTNTAEGYGARSGGGGYAKTAEPQAQAPAPAPAQTQAPAAAAAPAVEQAPASRAVALEPRARQVATSEGSVSVEEGEDGAVRIVVRARRSLTVEEEEDLRRRLRRELNLRESDTITIRQP